MRRIRIFEHASLDGVIQNTADDGDFPYADWTAPYRTPAGLDTLVAMQGPSYDLLLGRRTYDMFSAYWPSAPSTPNSDALNRATKYVVTHRPESLAWGPCEALTSDTVSEVRRIKANGVADLIVWGSSTLTPMLLEHGLADELVLIVYPVIVGLGKRYFAQGAQPRAFELVETKALASGVVIINYRSAVR